MDEHGKRLLQACLAVGLDSAVGQWLASLTHDDHPPGDRFEEGCQILRDLECAIGLLANQVVRQVGPLMREDGTPTSAGLFLVRLSDADLRKLLGSVGKG